MCTYIYIYIYTPYYLPIDLYTTQAQIYYLQTYVCMHLHMDVLTCVCIYTYTYV